MWGGIRGRSLLNINLKPPCVWLHIALLFTQRATTSSLTVEPAVSSTMEQVS